MPTLLIQTNAALDAVTKEGIMTEATDAVARETGKPKAFVMVGISTSDMMFGGSTEPCAYMLLASLGAIGGDVNGSLVKALSAILEDKAGVRPDRVYINFEDVKDRNAFGWNGATFAR